jgi:hypothetical protein
MFRARNVNGPRKSENKEGIEMKSSSVSETGRKPLSSDEHARFEKCITEIFSRLGMD